jgi:hypothetical protein
VPLEVVSGDHKGRWADLTIFNVNGKDYQFRNLIKVVTGIDLSEDGARLDYEDFKTQARSGVFEAKLGPEKRKKKAGLEAEKFSRSPDFDDVAEGDLFITGFSKCFKLVKRVRDRVEGEEPLIAAAAAATAATTDVPAETGEDDIPF